MKKYRYLIPALAGMLLAQGCSKLHEYPQGIGTDPSLVDVELSLNADMYGVDVSGGSAAGSEDPHDLRCIVDFYVEQGVAQGLREKRIVLSGDEIPWRNNSITVKTRLHANLYRIRVWVDHVRKGAKDDLYYDTADLCAVCLMGEYAGCEDARNALCGWGRIDLRNYRDRYFGQVKTGMTLERPFGMFRIETTDLQKFIDGARARSGGGEPAYVRIAYSNFFPCGYNVEKRFARAEDFQTGIGFRQQVPEIADGSEECAVLAYDYVFVCESETVVHAVMTVYDAGGTVINSSGDLRIALKRNATTVISDEFLTRDFGGGGAGVDDSFDDEIIIELPD